MKITARLGFLLLLLLVGFRVQANLTLPAPAAIMENSTNVLSNNPVLPTPRNFPMKPKRMSLNEAILLALRNNPDVISSELQRVLDKFAVVVAHNEFEPQYTLGATANFDKGSTPTFSVTPGVSIKSAIGTVLTANYENTFTGTAGGLALDFKQPLLKGSGWAFNTINLANTIDDEKIGQLNFKNSVITVVVAVIQSYRALVEDYNNLDIQKRTLLRAEERVRRSKLKVQAGQLAPNDLLQQEANVATTRLAVVQQQSSLYADYQNFLQALGLISTSKIIIDKQLEVTDYKVPSLKSVIRVALANNIDYQTAIIRLRATKRNVISAKNEARWQLDFDANTTIGGSVGSTTTNGTSASTLSTGSGPNFGFTLNIPINDVNAQQAILNARIALEQAKLALEEQKQQLVRNVTNQINQIHNQYEGILVAERAVELQQRALNNEELKLRYGKTTVFEVNQLQDELLEQETSLVADKIQFLNLITTLNQTLGITLDKWGITLRY